MIDEKALADRLADAASAQDNLLPRALSDDLAAGHRRLRRHRLLTGSGVLGGAAAVAVLAVGMTSWLTPDASPLPTDQPVAKASSTASASASAKPSAKVSAFKTVRPAGPITVNAQDAAFSVEVQAILAKHFDPGKKHLSYESGPFRYDSQPGQRTGGGRAGWKIAGQEGEGMLTVSLAGSGTGTRCGDYEDLKPTCHSTPMPGGGTATIGRLGDRAEISYRQPDGEIAYLAVNPLFGNNTTIPVHGMSITDAQLKAFVADPGLNLPAMTPEEAAVEEQLKHYAPTDAEVLAFATQSLPGGKVHTTYVEEYGGNYLTEFNWKKGSISATVEIGVDAKLMASQCKDQLSVPKCTPITLPDGKKVEYHQGARTYQEGPEYVMGATYVQPDGDLASVRILYPGKKLPAGAATTAQVLAMVTDPALDK